MDFDTEARVTLIFCRGLQEPVVFIAQMSNEKNIIITMDNNSEKRNKSMAMEKNDECNERQNKTGNNSKKRTLRGKKNKFNVQLNVS